MGCCYASALLKFYHIETIVFFQSPLKGEKVKDSFHYWLKKKANFNSQVVTKIFKRLYAIALKILYFF